VGTGHCTNIKKRYANFSKTGKKEGFDLILSWGSKASQKGKKVAREKDQVKGYNNFGEG